MSHALLVDESHLLMRNINVPELKKLHTTKGEPVGGIYGVLSSINRCLKNDPTIDKVYLLKDGYAKWRKDLFPGYKASRGNNPDSPKYKSYISVDPVLGWSPKDTISWTRKKLTEISNTLGLRTIYDETSEADDLAFLVGKELLEKGEKITFLTSDKDWSQLIWIFKENNISIYDGMKGEFINYDNFKEKYEIDPEWFIFYKAMIGDGSDDIPGVIEGCGPKAIEKIIEMAREKGLHPDDNTFKDDLNKLIESLDESSLGRYKKIKNFLLESSQNQFDLNIKLVDFRKCPHKSTIKEDINKENDKNIKIDWMQGSVLLKDLEFGKLGADIITPGSVWYRLN